MKKIIYLFLTFVVALSFTYAQQYTKAPVSDDTWKPVTLNNDGTTAIFLDDMNGDNTVAGLEARGWVILNEDGGGTTDPWFQGGTVFNAYEGPADGHVASNYQGANGLLIDQWLISQEITVSAGDTLSFWYRAPDGSVWPDSLYIRYSTTAGITPGDFDQTWGRYEVPLSWTRWTGTFSHSGTIRFAIQYYITDAATNSNYIGIDYIEVISAGGGPTLITIAEAIEDLNLDLIPDRLGQTVMVEGVVFSPNYQSSNNSFYIDDGTAGTDIFTFGSPIFTWAMGDMLQITGEVTQYNGMTEIVPPDSSGWVFLSAGNPTPDPIVLTLAQYIADPEAYEGSLIGFISLSLVGGTWPVSGSTNLDLSDGIDTMVFRIDSDTDIPGQPEPTWPQDVLGIGSQYCSGGCVDDGYQILPRFYSTDFLPPGTIPVELTSFVASVNENSVTLNWTTATETNNLGFEIQRNSGSDYQAIGFVTGNGTTTETQEYSFTDIVTTGSYSYRLKQVDYDGTFSYSEAIQVEVDVTVPDVFALEQNYPNPFNPSTKINFSLAVNSKVNLKVFDVLGQEVANLISSDLVAGSHNVDFSASGLNSGVYFYRIDATGIDGTNFTNVKKMILTK